MTDRGIATNPGIVTNVFVASDAVIPSEAKQISLVGSHQRMREVASLRPQ